MTAIPAVMVTDTALFRDPNYHELSDERLARVVVLEATILERRRPSV